MRYLFPIALLLLFITSCSNSSSSIMTLTGEVKGLKKGSLYLQKLDDTLFTTIDSIQVDGDANFAFSTSVASPEIYYLTMTFEDSSNVVRRLPFFAENSVIDVRTSLEAFTSEAKITGSTNQEKWEEHGTLIKRYNDKKLDLIEVSLNALKDGNDSLVVAIRAQQDKLLIGKYLATVNYALNNKDYEVAPYLMVSEVYDANVTYLDTIYNSLTPKIKDSKYGKALESLIKDRKE